MDTGFSFSDVYDEVVARTGGEQTTAEDVTRVQRGLRLLLERWEAKGVTTWRHRYMDIISPTESNEITLDRRVDDIIHVVRSAGGGLDRKPLDRMYVLARQERLAGVPSSYALMRGDPPKLLVYPWGVEAEYRLWYVERPAEFRRGADNTDDVPGRWLEALILGLAHDFARKRPPYNEPLIQRLKAEAAEAEDLAMRAERDRARYRYRISG